jgi:carboxyl-terminal processing protease
MQGMRATTAVLLLLVVCVISYAQVTAQVIPVRQNGKIHPAVKGFWKSIGNGYMLDASADSIRLYSYTTHFTYQEKNDYSEGLLNSQASFTMRGDTLSIFPADYGKNTTILQVRNDFVRMPALPQNTISFTAMQQLSAVQLFDLYLETMQENYAFSKERRLDWKIIADEYRKKLTDRSTHEELFNVLGDIATLTKDHHTKVIAQDGKTLQYRSTRSGNLAAEAFARQSEIKTQNEFNNVFFSTSYRNISDSLLQGKGQKLANGKIEWGSLNNDIGYIHIYSFSGFAPGGFSRKQQLDSIYHHMNAILGALKEKKALIVDVSFNFGGYDAAFLAIAGFFTDQPRLAYTSQVFRDGQFYNEADVWVHPSGNIQFTRPVYLLVTDISRSAAEGFAMAMRTLPNVKIAGTNTMGILSSMLGKSVSSFYTTSSNQKLVSPAGKSYEVTGIDPDIPLIVFTRDNLFNGHKDAVKKLAGLIRN